MLINNGFTPEWITLRKEIDQDIEALKEEIKNDRMYLGPYPLSDEDTIKWEKIYESNKNLADSINIKINMYNLIVPMMNKQKFHVEFDQICEDILKSGEHSVVHKQPHKQIVRQPTNHNEDIIGFFNALGELLTFNKKKKIN